MSQMIYAPDVKRPVPEPLTSSVLDHATVQDISHFGLRNNEGLWPSYNCLDLLTPTPICPDPLLEGYKEFDFAQWQPAFEFAVYGGVQCKAVGLDVADMKAETSRVFAASEGKGVERALMANRFVASTSGSAQWDAPVDLTPGSSTPLMAALGLLEGYAASVYTGKPTIHMPRAAAVTLGDKIVWEGDKAYTRSGAKVAIGGGYDDETDLVSGLWTMYATGEVYVERSETINLVQHVIPGDGSGIGSDENGLADNTVLTLAERMYRVAVDCFVAKATGKAW